jgi:hypothetical protein
LTEEKGKPVNPDFAWVKVEVAKALDFDEPTKRLWLLALKELETEGEDYFKKQLDVMGQVIKADAISRLTNLESKVPPEE